MNIGKSQVTFAPREHIAPYLENLFEHLRTEDYLQGQNEYTFAARAVFYMAEMNAVHPFRDGNGRTQREFIRELALSAGYTLNWSRVSPAEMMVASRRSLVER